MPPDIEIYIDKIVLEGFDGMHTEGLETAIREHLSTLIAAQGLPQGFSDRGEYGRLNGGQISIGAASKPAAVGGEIAQGIYQGISGKYTKS